MTWSFVGSAAANSGTNGSTTVTYTAPSAVQAGDFMVICGQGYNGGGSLTMPSGWTTLTSAVSWNGSETAIVLYRIAQAGDGGTVYTVTSSSTAWWSGFIYAIRSSTGLAYGQGGTTATNATSAAYTHGALAAPSLSGVAASSAVIYGYGGCITGESGANTITAPSPGNLLAGSSSGSSNLSTGGTTSLLVACTGSGAPGSATQTATTTDQYDFAIEVTASAGGPAAPAVSQAIDPGPVWLRVFGPRGGQGARLQLPVAPPTLFSDTDVSGPEADGGEAVTASLADTDGVTGTESGSVFEGFSDYQVAQPGRAWQTAFVHTSRQQIPIVPLTSSQVTDGDACSGSDLEPALTEFCHGEDSGFTALHDSDTEGPAADLENQFRFADTDRSGPGADGGEAVAGTYQIADSDAVTAEPVPLQPSGQYEYWSGPLADTDASNPAAENWGRFPFADTDAVTGTDGHIIGIYSFQPPFRFTGGGYELKPGRRAADIDYGRSQEYEEPVLHVSVHVAEALTVTAAVS